jgi:lipoprotein-releasing system ATP-binding protein
MITAVDLHKSYGSLHVLRGAGLTVGKGEFLAIMGKSGAGKSTLLHLLGGLDTADSGSLQVDGLDVRALKGKALARFRNERVGFVFQFHHLLPEFTALENAAMPALIAGKSQQEAYAVAREMLSYLDLSARMDHKPSELSGGEQQRVAVARALVNRPAVVFADEPSGNLDSATAEELHHLLLRLRNDFGQTFVIVTHNPELAELCDRTLHMANGGFLQTS